MILNNISLEQIKKMHRTNKNEHGESVDPTDKIISAILSKYTRKGKFDEEKGRLDIPIRAKNIKRIKGTEGFSESEYPPESEAEEFFQRFLEKSAQELDYTSVEELINALNFENW